MVEKKEEKLPRQSFWGQEIEKGVYKTEYGDILTTAQIRQGLAGCLMVLIFVGGMITGCTMRVHEEIQKRRENSKKQVTTPKVESVTDSKEGVVHFSSKFITR